VKLEAEIGEKIIDSPLRRAREYACNIAGSPSPIRRIVRKGTFEFSISPQKEIVPETVEKSPFGIVLEKGGSKTAQKAAKAVNSNTVKTTPEKKVAAISS